MDQILLTTTLSYTRVKQNVCTLQHIGNPSPEKRTSIDMAQKQKLHRILAGLSDKQHAQFVAMSGKHRVSVASLGRQAITEFLERYRNQELQFPLTLERRGNAKHEGR